MQRYVERIITQRVKRKLQSTPAVAILGPRQSGKSTLAKVLIATIKDSIYLDIERPSDMNKLRDPEAFLSLHKEKLICIDEIQRMPELFPILRSLIDENIRNGQFLLLGSASPDLIRQSSESLAGRISYMELTQFLYPEVVGGEMLEDLRTLWLRGGFPRSYLADSNMESFEWRLDFIKTFLERDIPNLGFRIPSRSLERFWQMSAHVHGQLVNSSKLGESLGVTHHTVKSYIDIMEQTFIFRVLSPYAINLKKRLVKSPKIFIRDAGLLHALLGIETQNDLMGHPVYGASWEGFVIENVLSLLMKWRAAFYRTASGSEIDLILEKGNRRIAVECKASSSPSPAKGFWNAIRDLGLEEVWIIAPVKEAYPIEKNVTVSPLGYFIQDILKIDNDLSI